MRPDTARHSRTQRSTRDLLMLVTGLIALVVPGEGFEPPKLSRLIYSQLPLATRATWLGFADPWWRPWAELYITHGVGLQPVSQRVASVGLADRCAEVQDSWRTRRST